MLPLARKAITVVVAGEKEDRYGNIVADWENATLYPVRGSVQPAVGEVAMQHRTSGTTEYSVYVPFWLGEHLKPGWSRIRYRGIDHELSAPPLLWDEGSFGYVEVPIQDVAG